MPVSLPVLLLGAQLVSAVSDGPPNFNIDPTCKNAGVASVSNAGADGCLRSEREAHGTLKREWSRFNAPAKRQCSQQSNAGGLPSYVELLTCLELASGTVPTAAAPNSATSGQGAPNRTSKPDGQEGSALTREPSPSLRIDPLRVLRRD